MPAGIDYAHGISAIDARMVPPTVAAVHLVIEDGHAAVVDTGSNDSVPHVLDALARRGVAPERVDWILLTHVHLDHAGGAGLLSTLLPNARVAVHPRGARHMVDPSMLWAGTVAVYGEAGARAMYGEIVPIPAQRIFEAVDGASVRLGAREFTFIDTPGHARHHVCIRDGRSGHVFAGDTFGVSYRSMDVDGRAFAFPSTTPVQFDPAALHASIDRIAALAPEAVYVTHFGQVRDVPRLAADLHRLIDAHAALALGLRDAGADRNARLREGLRAMLHDEARRQRWPYDASEAERVLALDLALNADGLEAWLDAQASR